LLFPTLSNPRHAGSAKVHHMSVSCQTHTDNVLTCVSSAHLIPRRPPGGLPPHTQICRMHDALLNTKLRAWVFLRYTRECVNRGILKLKFCFTTRNLRLHRLCGLPSKQCLSFANEKRRGVWFAKILSDDADHYVNSILFRVEPGERKANGRQVYADICWTVNGRQRAWYMLNGGRYTWGVWFAQVRSDVARSYTKSRLSHELPA
jgi:(2Fe-2S) ferredoxin